LSPRPVCTSRDPFSPERGGNTALGFASSRIFRTPVGALTRARPRVGHQPPETASGSYPLMGFFLQRQTAEMTANQSPVTSMSGTPPRSRPVKDDPAHDDSLRPVSV
jgi:hypothetical protein